ncbi:hypothetical protein Tco_1384982, partial [Tanacetum coccineum]
MKGRNKGEIFFDSGDLFIWAFMIVVYYAIGFSLQPWRDFDLSMTSDISNGMGVESKDGTIGQSRDHKQPPVAWIYRLHGRESGAGFERCKRLTKKACEGTYMEFVVGEVNKKVVQQNHSENSMKCYSIHHNRNCGGIRTGVVETNTGSQSLGAESGDHSQFTDAGPADRAVENDHFNTLYQQQIHKNIHADRDVRRRRIVNRTSISAAENNQSNSASYE